MKPYYEQVISGKKTFEIIYNDRGYNAGDTVEMYCDEHPYIGKNITAEIGYVTAFQQQNNYVVFSLLNVRCDYV